MKRALQNSLRSRCGFVLQCIGLFAFLAGTVVAQSLQPLPGQKKPAVTPGPQAAATSTDNSPGTRPTANVYSSPAVAGQQILFSVDLVIAGEPTLQSWFQQHSKESVRQFPGPIDKASPIKVPAEARLSLLTQLNRDAESAILASPALVTNWNRAVSYNIRDFGEDDSFFSLSLTPQEVGGGEIGLNVKTQLRPKADNQKVTGPEDLNWEVRGPLGNAFLFPVADVASRRKLILIVRPSIAAAPLAPSPYAPTRLATAATPSSASPARGFVAQPPAAQRVAQAFRPPTVERGVAPEAAVLQMLVLDVDSRIANDVLSKTRIFENDQFKSDVQSPQIAGEEPADDVKELASTSRSFTMDATLGKLFIADLRKRDESFKVISRPQVRSLIGVAAALDVRGLSVSGQNAAGTGSLKIHVTPKKIDDKLAVRTWLSLSQHVRPSPDSDGSTGPKFEAEATVKCPLGSSAVMVLGNDQNGRSIVVLTDVVSIQQIEFPKLPTVAKSPRPVPRKPGDRPAASADAKQMRLVTLRSIADADVSAGDTVDVFVVVGEGGDAKQQAVETICESVKVHGFTKSGLGGTSLVTLLVEKEAVEGLLVAELSGTLRLIPHQPIHAVTGGISPRSRDPRTGSVEPPQWASPLQENKQPTIFPPVRQEKSGQQPLPPTVQVSGVRRPVPQSAPKSEAQQVLDEVREMRKLIQGLRDDMSLLRDSVMQPEQKTSQNDVWIQQGESQVFARGRKIIQVSGQDPAVIEVQALAADRLRLTGKKPGRTTLKCLFVGDAVPTSFTVEVLAAELRSATRPAGLVPHAADHLPGEKVYRTNPTREPVAVQRGPQTDIRLRRNDVYPVKRDKSVARIVLGSSEIVRVAQHSSKEFVIIGVRPGHTSLLVWSDGETDPELFQISVFPSKSEFGDDNALSLTDSTQGDSARRLIEEALKKETSIDIDDGTLLDAIRQLHETAGVNIAVDTRALEEEGVSTDAKVSIHVAGVSLRSVLKLLLTEHNLAVLIEDEVLKVTSRQRAEGRQIVVAYRVSEFVDQSPDDQAGFDELISLITTVVEPDSWQEVGGNGSVAANLPTKALVIRQTQDVHEQIQQLLSALRNWTKTASGQAVLPTPIAVGVDELEGGRFSGFAPIGKSQPSLGAPTPSGGPISTGDDSLPEPARPPGNTGAPIEAR